MIRPEDMDFKPSIVKIKARPLERSAYEKYGKIIAGFEDTPYVSANMDTARRYNNLCDLENLRADKAKLNLCVFECSPVRQIPVQIKLLEKHQYSTQVFLPTSSDALFLTIVCQGKDSPDLDTLTAFVCEGSIGISYYPGIWHYPMTCLDNSVIFNCLVYEDGTKDDCNIFELDTPISIEL